MQTNLNSSQGSVAQRLAGLPVDNPFAVRQDPGSTVNPLGVSADGVSGTFVLSPYAFEGTGSHTGAQQQMQQQRMQMQHQHQHQHQQMQHQLAHPLFDDARHQQQVKQAGNGVAACGQPQSQPPTAKAPNVRDFGHVMEDARGRPLESSYRPCESRNRERFGNMLMNLSFGKARGSKRSRRPSSKKNAGGACPAGKSGKGKGKGKGKGRGKGKGKGKGRGRGKGKIGGEGEGEGEGKWMRAGEGEVKGQCMIAENAVAFPGMFGDGASYSRAGFDPAGATPADAAAAAFAVRDTSYADLGMPASFNAHFDGVITAHPEGKVAPEAGHVNLPRQATSGSHGLFVGTPATATRSAAAGEFMPADTMPSRAVRTSGVASSSSGDGVAASYESAQPARLSRSFTSSAEPEALSRHGSNTSSMSGVPDISGPMASAAHVAETAIAHLREQLLSYAAAGGDPDHVRRIEGMFNAMSVHNAATIAAAANVASAAASARSQSSRTTPSSVSPRAPRDSPASVSPSPYSGSVSASEPSSGSASASASERMSPVDASVERTSTSFKRKPAALDTDSNCKMARRSEDIQDDTEGSIADMISAPAAQDWADFFLNLD